MIQHLFKLMWNSKRNHSLLIIEILISFMVLFAVWSLIFSEYSHYARPMGFDYKDVRIIQFENINSNVEFLVKNKDQIINRIKAFDEVEAVTINTGPLLFEGSTHSTAVYYDKIHAQTDILSVGEQYQKVLNIPIKEGRWFSRADEIAKETPIIISQKLKEALFSDENAVGKIISSDLERTEGLKKIIGVIEDLKWKGDFHNPNPLFIQPAPTARAYNFLVKVHPTADAAFDAKLAKSINQIAKGWLVDVELLEDWKAAMNKTTFIPIIILLIVCSFLIFNVALGLFGILWYNINKRKEEIGLRRALGATQGSIANQFVGEILVIATFALIIGIFFAIQFPILNVFSFLGFTQIAYVKAIIMAVFFIYTLVILCAFYPSWQASKLHPAIALHEE